jgi:heat shock protein HtpX
MNGYARTALLLAAMTALFLFIGMMLGGKGGMMIALVVALGMNLFAYWNSDSMVLRSYNAQPIDPGEYKVLDAMLDKLSANAGFSVRPKAYLIHNDQPNAFATGRNPEHAAVAVTSGLLRMLSPQEVEAVLAHEFAHIKNHDTLIMTITATISGALSMLANIAMFLPRGHDSEGRSVSPVAMLLMSILAPLAASVVQMAISRSREYEADRVGAQLCGDPVALATALEKISGMAQRIPNEQAEAHPATAHLFIMNPLSGGGSLMRLFSTHPDPAERIALLYAMAGSTPSMAQAQGAETQQETQNHSRGPWG